MSSQSEVRPTGAGEALLGEDDIATMRAVDDIVRDWGRRTWGARDVGVPAVSTVQDLNRIDYFANFPHLGNVVTTLRDPEPGMTVSTEIDPQQLDATQVLIPSAACYGIYFAHQGSTFHEPQVFTTRVQCARAEDYYDGLRRRRFFSMREVVYLGTQDGAAEFAEQSIDWFRRISDAAGLGLAVETATDPFFRPGGRDLLQTLSETKKELVYGDLAVGSVNRHRNFFGERCDITGPDGEYVYTSCMAAGLERWLSMLLQHSDGDLPTVVEALQRAARRT